MPAEVPRLNPPHPHWQFDLPERDGPALDKPALERDDLNAISPAYLELSRASSRVRGMLTALALVGIVFFVAGVVLTVDSNFIRDLRTDPMAWIALLMLCAMPAVILFALRLDLTMPRDNPLRFNRKTGKVYVHEFARTSNPFGPWGCAVKVYDWNTLEAEQTRHLSFNGRFFVMRYGLEIAACAPRSHQVLDRFWVDRNVVPTNFTFAPKWAFIRAFMHGDDIRTLPTPPPREQSAAFGSLLKKALPWLDRSSEGRAWEHEFWPSVFMLFNFLLAPLLLVVCIFEYIALRFAPAAEWPEQIDRESRSA
jgi:hypothetical protein